MDAEKMKDSGIEWLGDIPSHWKIYRVKFLCDIVTGNKDTVDRDDEGNFPFFVRSPKVEKINSYSYDGEAILMAGDGVGAGKVFHYFNGKFDFHQRVYNLHRFKNVIGKYFFYYLSENFYREIEKGSAKSTVDSVRLPMILNFPVPLPPLDEQKQIADFLDRKCSAIDSAVDNAKKLVEKLREYKKSLITETVTKGLNPSAQIKIKFKYLISLKSGDSVVNSELDDFSEYPVYGGGKIIGMFKDYNIEKNNIIIGRVGGAGNVTILEKNSWATDNALIVETSVNKKYLYYLLVSSDLNKLNTSNAQPLITAGKILNLKTDYFPNESDQKKIADFLDKKCAAIDESICRREKLIEKLTEYKKSLIYEAVTGKISL